MKIKVEPDGLPSFEITPDDSQFLSDLKGLLPFSERRKTQYFTLCREYQTRHRGLLSSIALEYYRKQNYPTEGLHLICQPGWICDGLVELERVKLSWDKTAIGRAAPPLSHRSFPHDGGLADNVLKVFPNTRLENLKSYRLLKLSSQGNSFELTFTLGDYFEYVNSCEALAFELCEAVVSQYGNTITKQSAPSPVPLDISKLKLPHRRGMDIYNFSSRGAVPGINTLLIRLDPRRRQHMFYYHSRKGEVMEAMNTRHVVPAGTFQPGTEDDQWHDRDFNMIRNVKREFAEELLGQEEVRNLQAGDKDFTESGVFKPYEDLFREGNIKLFFMGLGLDPLTTKPEILTCMVVNGQGLEDREVGRSFVDCFEGK